MTKICLGPFYSSSANIQAC